MTGAKPASANQAKIARCTLHPNYDGEQSLANKLLFFFRQRLRCSRDRGDLRNGEPDYHDQNTIDIASHHTNTYQIRR